jgi:hypothetical protein
LTFTANVTSADPDVTPTFKWAVSAGEIIGGQGTYSITVDTWKAGGQSVTATVDVGGYHQSYYRDCKTSASCTIIEEPPIRPRKLDEYGGINFNDERARLDNYAIELQNDPTAQGYLVCYGGRRSRAGEAQRRCDRAMKYTSTYFRGIDPMRLVTVDAGYREQPAVELWVVPSGANPPQASPTVDPREVRPAAPPRKPRRVRR